MENSDELLTRRHRLVTSLPPLEEVLRGSFFVRHRRCGKPSCRCARGPGHRVAVVGITFRDGSTEQIAVPRELEPVARAWVRNYGRWWEAVERLSAINRELLRRRLVDPAGPKVGPRSVGSVGSRSKKPVTGPPGPRRS